MTEWEKAQNGYLYDANYDKEIIEARTRCADLCYEFNNCRPSDTEKQQKLLGQILGRMGADPVITAPFYCDYGFNVSIGKIFIRTIMLPYLTVQKLLLGIMYLLRPTAYFLQPDMLLTVNREVGDWKLPCQLQ